MVQPPILQDHQDKHRKTIPKNTRQVTPCNEPPQANPQQKYTKNQLLLPTQHQKQYRLTQQSHTRTGEEQQRPHV